MLNMKRWQSRAVPDRLPSTEKTVTFHALRVHLQIMFWKTLENEQLDPLEWGWSLCKKTLENDELDPLEWG